MLSYVLMLINRIIRRLTAIEDPTAEDASERNC